MVDDRPLTCDEFGRTFGDLIDGTGDTRFHRRVRARLESKKRCERCFENYKKTMELCRAQLGKEAPPQVAEKLASFLRKNARDG